MAKIDMRASEHNFAPPTRMQEVVVYWDDNFGGIEDHIRSEPAKKYKLQPEENHNQNTFQNKRMSSLLKAQINSPFSFCLVIPVLYGDTFSQKNSQQGITDALSRV
jgi:hypothetical protein